MLILFILYGNVSIAASGLADKIHPLCFQQTHGNLGFQGLQIHSELNKILMDKLLKTQELCYGML